MYVIHQVHVQIGTFRHTCKFHSPRTGGTILSCISMSFVAVVVVVSPVVGDGDCLQMMPLMMDGDDCCYWCCYDYYDWNYWPGGGGGGCGVGESLRQDLLAPCLEAQ